MLSVPIEVQFAANRESRQVEFWGSVFGVRDQGGIRVERGAFAKSIRERLPQGLVKLFRNHEHNIGRIRQAEERDYGLWCLGEVSRTQIGDETLEQMEDGSLTHCSFRAGVVRDRAHFVVEQDPTTGEDVETLVFSELIWREAGPVDLEPGNLLATIIAVRSFGGDEALDALFELPLLVRSFAGRAANAKLTREETRVARSLILLKEALDASGDRIRNLMAPGDLTPPPKAAPNLATPAGMPDQASLAMLQSLIRAMPAGFH